MMSITRDNHYVPIWYQRGFLEPGANKLAYRDLMPKLHPLPDGSTRVGSWRFQNSPKQCFVQKDLYSTFFGTYVSDEIEKRLFGAIDADGAPAIRAFIGEDVRDWHEHFQMFFRFIDAQKLRTPKGLDWLRAQYPRLSQNQLMEEMQAIQALHCTIWSEGVREIVSAVNSSTKFIISDHPVTVYNYALPPDAEACRYPFDPSIALKASQTIYPLDRDHCLILTNLEYAENEQVSPNEKRTFARNFRSSMVRTDAFARERTLSEDEVRQINRIIKARARRYIAAGKEEWLDPDAGDATPWSDLRGILRPPEHALFGFGGEMFARFEDGSVHYQDKFGRTEKERDFLKKVVVEETFRLGDACGCGSGRKYKECCKPLPFKLRPSWAERSIRERNLMLYEGVKNILNLDQARDWLEVRRAITDDHIRDVHTLYRALWPIETDILQLLPKPDGRPRAVYTGSLHPASITDFAMGSALYFGEVIIENPFVHAANVRPEFSPIDNPHAYHQEFVKAVFFFLTLMPLVEIGYVNLIPDPCVFDIHLFKQMMDMAQRRSAHMKLSLDTEPRVKELMELDFKRSLMSLPAEGLRVQIRKFFPELNETEIEEVIADTRQARDADPLAAVHDGLLEGKGGQFNLAKMAPNFEMALYLAQATGSAIITDSPHRWQEILQSVARQGGGQPMRLPAFAEAIAASSMGFVNDVDNFLSVASARTLAGYPTVMSEVFRYLEKVDHRGVKPNYEAGLAARLAKLHRTTQSPLRKGVPTLSHGRVHAMFPARGIQDNTVNRLLLMSSSECHLHSVPMAFFMEKIAK